MPGAGRARKDRPRKRNQPLSRRRPWTEAVGEPLKHSYSLQLSTLRLSSRAPLAGARLAPAPLVFVARKRAPAGLMRCKKRGLTLGQGGESFGMVYQPQTAGS